MISMTGVLFLFCFVFYLFDTIHRPGDGECFYYRKDVFHAFTTDVSNMSFGLTYPFWFFEDKDFYKVTVVYDFPVPLFSLEVSFDKVPDSVDTSLEVFLSLIYIIFRYSWGLCLSSMLDHSL